MISRRLLILTFLLIIPSIEASRHNPLRTESWFPHFHNEIITINTNNCSSELKAYLADSNAATCKAQLNCILENFTEYSKAAMASASILLGLLPVIIASLAPSLAEVALLSTCRPVLSALLAVAAPAVFISRPMDYTDPLELLEPGRGRFTLSRFSWRNVALLVSVGEYILIAIAIANMLAVAYQVGTSTILVWRCQFSYAPIAWTVLPIVVHLTATIPWMCSRTVRQLKRGQQAESYPKHTQSRTSWSTWLRTEPTPGAYQNQQIVLSGAPELWVVVLNNVATLMGFVHIIFGVMVYSSLSLISSLDALRIAARFFLSAIICRIVLTLEISGLRGSFTLRKEGLLSAELNDFNKSHSENAIRNERSSISKGLSSEDR